MSQIKFSTRAYCKILLHAAKYPHCAVNGVLLSKSTKGKDVEFVDVIPLFHIALNLTPMAEIALMQIDEKFTKQGLVISGYYTAPENVSSNASLDKAHHRIADKIANNHPAACLVLVDNESLSLQLDSIALKVAQFADGSYKLVDPKTVNLSSDNGLDVCSELLQSNAHNLLNDFDNHLDNVCRDWENYELNEQIENISAISA